MVLEGFIRFLSGLLIMYLNAGFDEGSAGDSTSVFRLALRVLL